MSDLFDVLSDATRRDIVELLSAGHKTSSELSVGQLVEALGITQPTVSKHLKVLRESGLVSVREEGQHRYYRLDAQALAPVSSWLGAIAPSASAPGTEPFVDLENLGRAAGGLLHDGVAAVTQVIAGLRK
jgi:DNA-binding transcriptional ArsR family regulator